MTAYNPYFIAIDGIDGTGKTTQVELLQRYMLSIGIQSTLTKEPGGTDVGIAIRKILLNNDVTISPNAEMLLFCADRAEHQECIREHMSNGKSVITDRFLPSTWAYQIFGRKLDPELLEVITPHTVHTLPDLTIILDLDIDVAISRAKDRLNEASMTTAEGRFEAEDEAFFKDVQRGFHWYAQQKRFGKVVIINAEGSIEELHKKIVDTCQSTLKWSK